MPTTNAMSLRDLRTSLQGYEPGRTATLAGLSLDVPQGEAVALIGRNRAANSAVLRAACGLLELVDGRILAEGRDVTTRPPHRRGFALVAPDRGLLSLASLGQGTLAAAVRMVSRGLDVTPILAATGLAGLARARLADQPLSVLRRTALAQAVASAPVCLLIDDPARGLDRAGAGEVFAAVRGVREAGMAMLIATTEMHTAMAVAERGVVMVGGAARQAGWLRELHDSPADDVTAGLLGEMNRLPGRVISEEDDMVTVRLDCGPIVEARREDAPVGAECVVCVRPGRIAIAQAAMAQDSGGIMGPGALSGRVRAQRFFGDIVWVDLEIGTERGRKPAPLGVARPAVVPMRLEVGDVVALAWQPQYAMAFRPMHRA